MQRSSVHRETQTATPQSPTDVICRLDRRRQPRYLMSGRVTIMRRSHDVDCYHQPICSVQLHDLCDGGLSAHSDMPLGVNEPVAVFFPPRGAQRGVDVLGHVLRCEPDSDGYRLALTFDYRPAA